MNDKRAALSELSEEDRARVRETRRFDLRRILGLLFVVFGLIVLITGIVTVTGTDELTRTGGIAINLWTGGAMLVLGLLFFLWDRLSPVPAEDIIRSAEHAEQERDNEQREDVESN